MAFISSDYLLSSQLMEPAVMCFQWSYHSQWLSVGRCLLRHMGLWSALILWAPPAIIPAASSAAMKAMTSSVPHLTFCNVKHQDFGIPPSRFVFVSSHLCVSILQDFITMHKSVIIKKKLHDCLKRLLLTSSVPSTVLQLSSAPLSRN